VHHDSMLIKCPTRCNSMQTFIYCRVTLHVSGVTAPIRNTYRNSWVNISHTSFTSEVLLWRHYTNMPAFWKLQRSQIIH